MHLQERNKSLPLPLKFERADERRYLTLDASELTKLI